MNAQKTKKDYFSFLSFQTFYYYLRKIYTVGGVIDLCFSSVALLLYATLPEFDNLQGNSKTVLLYINRGGLCGKNKQKDTNVEK
jgi:hypothetical protein